MKKYLVFIVFGIVSCTNESDTIRTLQSAGFTDIHTTGYDIFSCGQDDTFHTGFRAKNPAGQIVTGTVCCGIFKGCTIRF